MKANLTEQQQNRFVNLLHRAFTVATVHGPAGPNKNKILLIWREIENFVRPYAEKDQPIGPLIKEFAAALLRGYNAPSSLEDYNALAEKARRGNSLEKDHPGNYLRLANRASLTVNLLRPAPALPAQTIRPAPANAVQPAALISRPAAQDKPVVVVKPEPVETVIEKPAALKPVKIPLWSETRETLRAAPKVILDPDYANNPYLKRITNDALRFIARNNTLPCLYKTIDGDMPLTLWSEHNSWITRHIGTYLQQEIDNRILREASIYRRENHGYRPSVNSGPLGTMPELTWASIFKAYMVPRHAKRFSLLLSCSDRGFTPAPNNP